MRLFSKDHIWVLFQENGESESIKSADRVGEQKNRTATLGITDYAQKKLKSIMFLNLPDVDDELTISEKFGDVESIKTVSDLIAPLAGKVSKINEELVDDPSSINTAPYDCWLVEVEVTQLADDLLDEESYNTSYV